MSRPPLRSAIRGSSLLSTSASRRQPVGSPLPGRQRTQPLRKPRLGSAPGSRAERCTLVGSLLCRHCAGRGRRRRCRGSPDCHARSPARCADHGPISPGAGRSGSGASMMPAHWDVVLGLVRRIHAAVFLRDQLVLPRPDGRGLLAHAPHGYGGPAGRPTPAAAVAPDPAGLGARARPSMRRPTSSRMFVRS